MDGLSNSDVALLSDRANNGFFGGDGMAFWIFALLFLNNGGFGGNYVNSGIVTNADLNASQNAQTQQLQMQGLSDQLAQNKFDLAQVVNAQTAELVGQNNTNLINAIQGFNNLGLQLTNQTNVLSAQIMNLDAKMTQCCCEIKTQMLQDRLTDAQAKIVAQQAEISNNQQTQTILNTLGRFVAWAGNGSQAAVTTS
jgi:glutaminase